MTGRIRGVSSHIAEPLAEGWEVAVCAPGEASGPDAASLAQLRWISCGAPKPAAAALRDRGDWSLDGPPRRFDAEDWWYRLRFATARAEAGEELWLCFDGLATVAEAWLNGQPLLSAKGMFTAHERRVDSLLRSDNELLLRCHALDALLAAKRPRPRWRAPMVEHQQLRWYRTTLLGRTPGWSPPAAVVGPWRDVRLERRRGLDLRLTRLLAGADGTVEAGCELRRLDGLAIGAVSLVLQRNGREHRVQLEGRRGALAVHGRGKVPAPEPWWPHTHGEPALYGARLEVQRGGGVITADLGTTGFRSIDLAARGGEFEVRVNGARVFCRGACWTPLDPVSFANEPTALRTAFDQVVASGMNMVRVGGTMVYETDAFLDACDDRGVLLWQDFMFANLDYPEGDEAFESLVAEEARQQLGRLRGRPSLALLAGNSEGEQQAAMWGAPRDRWAPPLFHHLLAGIVRDELPEVPYWPSSAHGGDFPHQSSVGSSSYYGVGAYLRPLEDARRAEVRFASECLAFANIPGESSLARLPEGKGLKVHEAQWKARSPRDLGAGWDFDDVRDHYLARLFHLDPLALRSADHARYLELSRVVTGEVMAQVFGEWRRARSCTAGGLVWFLRDLWHGAGWGVVDAAGTPKAAWHYLRRALAPVAVHLSDEGGNGLAVHAINDGAASVSGTLSLSFWRAGEVPAGSGVLPVVIPPRGVIERNAVEWLDGFHDLSYAYRFGPAPHDLVAAVLRSDSGAELAHAFHFVEGWPSAVEQDLGLTANAYRGADGATHLRIVTRRFAQSVRIEVAGHVPDDNYFHLAPGQARSLTLVPDGSGVGTAHLQGTVRALNAEAGVKVSLP